MKLAAKAANIKFNECVEDDTFEAIDNENILLYNYNLSLSRYERVEPN